MDNKEAAEGVFEALVACLPNEEAAARIGAKPVMMVDVFRKLLPELKARAFTITGIEQADSMQRVRDAIATIPKGADWDAVKRQVKGELAKSPYFVNPEAEGAVRKAQLKVAEKRAETLLRHHGFQAYQAGWYELMDRQRDAFPFWQYVTVGDGDVRDSHRALDGVIMPASSPFWDSHWPPWDWNCRCRVEPVDGEDFEAAASGKSDYGRALSAVEVRELETSERLALPSGQVVSVAPPQGDGAFRWHPRDLRIPLEDLARSYDADVFAAFSREMRTSRVTLASGEQTSVWDWLLDPSRNVARQAILRQSRLGKELAVAVDYGSGRRLGATDGSRSQVEVSALIEEARREGRRIVLEHGHPAEGLDLPSPGDLLAMALNSDVVAAIGVHVGLLRHTVRMPAWTTKGSAETFVRQLLPLVRRSRDGELSAGEWAATFEQWVKQKKVTHEQRVQI